MTLYKLRLHIVLWLVLGDDPQPVPVNPCIPSPCGPNAECRVTGDQPSCSCSLGFIGAPPNCRPECVSNSECVSHLACINQKCRDPCPGTCGSNAQCRVVSHSPTCVCLPGYYGDPFSQCLIQQAAPIEEHLNPCEPSPCGANAVCREQNGAGSCTCLPEYIGNPYEGCRPECVLNTDCPSNKACMRNKCRDPCPGTCGQNADCQVVNHLPSCTCRVGYTGNPFQYCSPIPQAVEIEQTPVNPCVPSPCGPNSQCREVNGQAVCSCQPTYIGSPPACRPECTVSSECSLDKACVGQKCVNPCPGTCGHNAQCNVRNHSPICSCRSGFTGDPFTRCYPIPRKFLTPQQIYLCLCGLSPTKHRCYGNYINCFTLLQLLRLWNTLLLTSTPACHHLVVQMRIAVEAGVVPRAHAPKGSTGVLRIATRNVSSTQNAPATSLVSSRNAEILVRARAAPMRSAAS